MSTNKSGMKWLPTSELLEAITADDSSDRFIGGSVDRKAKTLTLLRGDITAIVAPSRIFPRSGDGTAPDFTRLRLTDHGRTIALGDYEASADAVLYELDPDNLRRKLNKLRHDRERTFGASLRQWSVVLCPWSVVSGQPPLPLVRRQCPCTVRSCQPAVPLGLLSSVSAVAQQELATYSEPTTMDNGRPARAERSSRWTIPGRRLG